MKAWAIVLVALIVGAGAVTAALLIPRDETSRVGTGARPGMHEPGFTVIDEDKDGGKAASEPAALPGPGSGSGSDAGSSAAPAGSTGRARVSVTDGLFADSSEGDKQEQEELEAEQEEEERRQEEAEQREEDRQERSEDRAKAREDRNDD